MKVQLLLAAVALVAMFGVASAAREDDVAATLGARWGHWTLERLSWKKEEIKSDLSKVRAEKARVVQWGKNFKAAIKTMGNARVQAAKEGVSEWTDILAIRRSQRGYHRGRHAGYDARHKYIVEGPKSRRNASDKKAWCATHKVSCDRWHHERRLYFSHKYHVRRHEHGRVTAHWRKQVKRAKARLARAQDRLAAARKWRKKHNKAARELVKAALEKWTKKIKYQKARLAAVNEALRSVRRHRKSRESTYKPFYMTKCRYIGGKHHMYYCHLDVNNASKAHHRFRVCKPRGPREANAGKLKFRCYK